MPRIRAGNIALNYLEHGGGDSVVLAVHGNLGCAHWLDLAMPLLPLGIRVIASEWRGCGASDKPEPAADFSNYSMATHAADQLALLDALGIESCHLYGHSTGGIIVSYMLTMAPERFRRVLMLDPVSPLGLELHPAQLDALIAMKLERDICFAGLATAAPTLFRPETLGTGQMPVFSESADAAQRALFELLVDKTRLLSDGIWFGTPRNLEQEWRSGDLAGRMPEMTQEHLILYGEQDQWIPSAHMTLMAEHLPNARLERFAGVGHSMNLEQPELFASIFGDYFRDAG
ncbi:alpha/beta hydrolase [Thiohalocapsa marina]|uniref:Alpha/beta hydrolase n=1 Tax=Thiohalocapsa marina TaxID=424902 RepID=A0A5M8FSG8_9GAMM|nr:alpha/beta hydrolase [Thiohalocapsa marina]KAA6186665.1 alpha/beta hydrolase [Thiohalocapsa marina]